MISTLVHTITTPINSYYILDMISFFKQSHHIYKLYTLFFPSFCWWGIQTASRQGTRATFHKVVKQKVLHSKFLCKAWTEWGTSRSNGNCIGIVPLKNLSNFKSLSKQHTRFSRVLHSGYILLQYWNCSHKVNSKTVTDVFKIS